MKEAGIAFRIDWGEQRRPFECRKNVPDRDDTGWLRAAVWLAARLFHGSSSQTAAYGPGVVLASAATSSATCHGSRNLPAMRAADRRASFHRNLVLRVHSMRRNTRSSSSSSSEAEMGEAENSSPSIRRCSRRAARALRVSADSVRTSVLAATSSQRASSSGVISETSNRTFDQPIRPARKALPVCGRPFSRCATRAESSSCRDEQPRRSAV